MISKFSWLFGIFFIPLVLSGCANSVFVDRSNSLVMPNHTAKRILEKYLGENWVENPYLNTVTNLFCKSEKIPIRFSDIKSVSYFPGLRNHIQLGEYFSAAPRFSPFSCDVMQKVYVVKVSNESDAQQITEALIALGAPINGYVKAY